MEGVTTDDRRPTTANGLGIEQAMAAQCLSWRVVEGEDGLGLVQHPEVVGNLGEAGRFLPQGAYTTLRTYDGTGLLALEQHFDRLEETARLLGHPVTLPRDELRHLLCEVLLGLNWRQGTDLPSNEGPFRSSVVGRRSSPSESRLRLTVDCSERAGEVWISVEPLPLPSPEQVEQGVAVLVRSMHRENPKAKDNAFIEASREARKLVGGETNEVLMIGEDGRVLEGLSSNFYGVRDGVVWTAEEGVLPGITRSMILEEAERAGIPVRLEAVPLDALATLDEAFLSSTSRAVLPVVRIEGQAVGDGRPGPVTRRLGQLYEARLQEGIERVCEGEWTSDSGPQTATTNKKLKGRRKKEEVRTTADGRVGVRMSEADMEHIRAAFEVARQARAHGNDPYGAVLVDASNQIVLRAENTVHTERDCTGHAETNLMRLASARFSPEELASCTLYTSTEPCAMCAAAIHWGNVGRMVFGLSAEAFYEMVGPSPYHLVLGSREVFARSKRPMEVVGPLLEDEARLVHRE